MSGVDMAGEGLGRDLDEQAYDAVLGAANKHEGTTDESVGSVGDFIIDQVIELGSEPDAETQMAEYEEKQWFPDAGESKEVDTVPRWVDDLDAMTVPGGKATNQAVAAARSGAETMMYGRAGNDSDAHEPLADAGVGLDEMEMTDAETGTAYILLEDDGENRILCYKDEGTLVDQDYIDDRFDELLAEDYLLATNGMETDVLCHLFARLEGHEDRPTVIFDPSPLDGVEKALEYASVDYVTPNEVEYAALEDELTAGDYDVIETMAEGAKLNGEQVAYSPDVDVVDTTAAGDTFNGYFAGGLAADMDETDAIQYAVDAASSAVTEKGAMPSVPDRSEVLSM
ncbi:MAG: PfkB family carbohydrate kinase [Candidatus Nanohaloarchaeota archaeon QJJ-5]|nr:PfkB family carbohydrate kinase [Candidatus Nanohaloarchaeota archaeon QJJ-5]